MSEAPIKRVEEGDRAVEYHPPPDSRIKRSHRWIMALIAMGFLLLFLTQVESIWQQRRTNDILLRILATESERGHQERMERISR